MSLLITSACIAGGVLLGRWIARRQASAPPDASEAAASAETSPEPPAPHASDPREVKPVVHDFRAFPCALGDVVVRTSAVVHEDRWLAGALILSEARPAAVLFVAPEAGGDRAVFVRPAPSRDLVWLEPLAESEVQSGGDPPTALEVRGMRYERARKLPLRAERIGAGAPDVGDSVILAEYAGAGAERLVLVLGAGGALRAWKGIVLEPGMYEVMPSGKSTLDDA